MGNEKPNVVVVGRFQIGKSTLVNCLLDDRVARTGEGVATTKISTIYTYGQVPAVDVAKTWKGDMTVWENRGCQLRDFLNPDKSLIGASAIRISLWKPLLESINLIDTPGIDANPDDTARAAASLGRADFVIVLLENKGLCEAERKLFADIKKLRLPFAVIINCRDKMGKRWFPDHNGEIVSSVSAELANLGHYPTAISGKDGVWACNLLWFWHASEHIFEEPDAADLCKDIEKYIDKHLKKKATAALTFSQSQFGPVRHFIEENYWEKKAGGKTPPITSQETLNFIEKLGEDHNRVAEIIEFLLSKCWFPATPAGMAAKALALHLQHYPVKSDGEDAKYHAARESGWFSELIAISDRYAMPDDPVWYKDPVTALTNWIFPVIRNLPAPYLVFCENAKRETYLHAYSQYTENVRNRVESLQKHIKSVFVNVDLGQKYRDLSAPWEAFHEYAIKTRDYLKAGPVIKIFAPYNPKKFHGLALSFQESCDAFVKSGNERLEPFFTECTALWKSALEPFSDVIHNIASHGQDLTPLAYRDYSSVKRLPLLTNSAFAKAVQEWMDGVLANNELIAGEKTRIYCIHRRLGFVSRKDSAQ